MSEAHIRLSSVYVENLPYQNIITKYDRPESFFYLDPPYWGCENDYGKGLFAREDFAVLAQLLSNIEGKFIMSINDTVETREIFKDFRIETADVTYSISNANTRSKTQELLILNY